MKKVICHLFGHRSALIPDYGHTYTMNQDRKIHGKNSELVDVSVQILQDTEKALLVTEGLRKEGKLIQHWIPKRVVDGNIEDRYPKVTILTMPRWLFEEKGFTSDD